MSNTASTKKNPILDKAISFSRLSISLHQELMANKQFVIADQFLRSATSIGANIHEAQSAESGRNFLHKMKIAAKEVSETEYWLLLMNGGSSQHKASELMIHLTELKKILSKIIVTSNERYR